MDSMKHAASRPSPPLPRPASGSCSKISASLRPLSLAAAFDQGREHQVRDVVRQRPADQELHREVVDLLGIDPVVLSLGPDPALGEHVADGGGHGLELLAGPGLLRIDDVVEHEPSLVQGVVRAGELDGPTPVPGEEFAEAVALGAGGRTGLAGAVRWVTMWPPGSLSIGCDDRGGRPGPRARSGSRSGWRSPRGWPAGHRAAASISWPIRPARPTSRRPWEAGVGDLVPVQVEYRQHAAVAGRVEEFVSVPSGGEGAGLRLAVADDAGDDQVRVVEGGAVGVAQGVAELAALVDAARRLRGDVAGDAPREAELLEQPLHSLRVPADLRIDLAVGPLEVGVGDHRWAALPRADDVDHVQVIPLDDPVEVAQSMFRPGDVPQWPSSLGLMCSRSSGSRNSGLSSR